TSSHSSSRPKRPLKHSVEPKRTSKSSCRIRAEPRWTFIRSSGNTCSTITNRKILRKRGRPLVRRLNNGSHSASGAEITGHPGANRVAGLHDVTQDAIDRIFVKDSQIAIRLKVHLQRLQFQAHSIRRVFDGDDPEVRQTGFRTHRRVFGNGYGDF